MNVRACIFDLDGTILYTLDAIALAGNRMLRELGFPEQPEDDYRYYCGDGADNLVKRCLKKVDGYTDENFRSGCILNRKFLAEEPSYGVHPYEGMREVLTELKRRGILLAVFSNKPDDAAQETVKESYGDLFDIVRGQIKGIPIKPDPDGALYIARELGVQPGQCMYFGDTWTDMQTGRSAGMETIGVLWGYRDEKELVDNGADRVIREPSEILKLVNGR